MKGHYIKVMEINSELENINKEIEEAFVKWEEIQKEIEELNVI